MPAVRTDAPAMRHRFRRSEFCWRYHAELQIPVASPAAVFAMLTKKASEKCKMRIPTPNQAWKWPWLLNPSFSKSCCNLFTLYRAQAPRRRRNYRKVPAKMQLSVTKRSVGEATIGNYELIWGQLPQALAARALTCWFGEAGMP